MASDNVRNVLLVDDDGDLREAAAPVLVQRGYEIHHAACGASALWLLRRLEIDLVVIDGSVPDCAEFLSLKKRDPRLEDIRVLLITVGATEITHEDAAVDLEMVPSTW
jgi:two-component system, OmpR family, response regulator